MKTKELIRQLQEVDPSGEVECCVGNSDIYLLELLPAYYDGCLQILKRDQVNNCYNVIGAKYTSKGNKVNIVPLSISDAIFNEKDFPIEYNELHDTAQERYRESDEKTRRSVVRIERKLELKTFLQWAMEQSQNISSNNLDGLRAKAIDFFEAHLSPDDTLTPGEGSYHDRRKAQWTNTITVRFDGLDWDIEKIIKDNN